MTITPSQAKALSGYLQRIGFSGVVLDPNDHDESIFNIVPFLPTDPYIRVYSFKPAIHPNVLNGGHLFTYGITAESVDAIVTGANHWDHAAVEAGMKALKPHGLFVRCTPNPIEPKDRALLVRLKVGYTTHIDVPNPGHANGYGTVIIGEYKGGM